MENRDERLAVLLTLEERDELTRAAESVGLKVSTYVRVAALAQARRGTLRAGIPSSTHNRRQTNDKRNPH